MTKPRLLLTGATGFVGSKVSQNLPEHFEIHCVSGTPINHADALFHQANLRNENESRYLIEDIRPTHLIHTAWETNHGEFWESPRNLEWLEAGKALFSAFADNGGLRIVGCGSCAEYATVADTPLLETDDNENPETLYGRSKLELLRFLQQMDISYAWARIFLTYGPNEDQRRLIPSISNALLKGDPAKCSSGKQIRDFIDVRDLGRAIAKLATADVVGAINIGHGKPTQIANIAERLGELSGKPSLIELGALPDRASEPPYLVPDLTRQHNELNFWPQIELNQGLSDALDWWRTNKT